MTERDKLTKQLYGTVRPNNQEAKNTLAELAAIAQEDGLMEDKVTSVTKEKRKKALKDMKDEDIDYSDTPKLDEEFFDKAKLELPKVSDEELKEMIHSNKKDSKPKKTKVKKES